MFWLYLQVSYFDWLQLVGLHYYQQIWDGGIQSSNKRLHPSMTSNKILTSEQLLIALQEKLFITSDAHTMHGHIWYNGEAAAQG